MGTLIATYLVAVAAACTYAVWIAVGAHRITKRIERMRSFDSGASYNPVRAEEDLHEAA